MDYDQGINTYFTNINDDNTYVEQKDLDMLIKKLK